MPLYGFKCCKCKHTFEDLVKIGTIEKECPKCGDVGYKEISKASLGGFDKFGRSK